MTLAKDLLQWYDQSARKLPWRGVMDPYRVWLSEIMLQQTRAETVIRYYGKFLEVFPTVFQLAEAEEDQVLKLWEGLGYYSRARSLHAAAKLVVREHHGVFPKNARELRTLPGVGPYAANAIASIVSGEPVPALDGNQARVLSRILTWDAPLKTPFDLESPASQLLSQDRPGDYNQALMDLGASICTPKRPRCGECPIRAHCRAAEEGDPETFPRKKPPIVKREQPLTVTLILCGPDFCVRKRPAKGLLAGMYEFPMLDGHLEPDEIVEELERQGFKNVRFAHSLPDAHHVFTHLVWKMRGALLQCDAPGEGWQRMRDLDAVAFPSALRVYREIASELSCQDEETMV